MVKEFRKLRRIIVDEIQKTQLLAFRIEEVGWPKKTLEWIGLLQGRRTRRLEKVAGKAA